MADPGARLKLAHVMSVYIPILISESYSEYNVATFLVLLQRGI